MISRTKYQIDHPSIAALFQAAGIHGLRAISPLGAGEYNAVFAVTAGETEYVLKIAPTDDVPVLRYETGIMASELFWYEQMRAHTSIRVPKIYASDFSRALIPADYFIMEKLPGLPLDRMKLSAAEKEQTTAATANMAAQIHNIKHDSFGYLQNGLHGNWYEAIRAMVSALQEDCARMGKRSKRAARLLAYIDVNRDILARAPCCMVNFDIWLPNIIGTREDDGLHYAWIDPERSFWGDPVADFVCLEMTKALKEKKRSLAAYNAQGDSPLQLTREEEIRYSVAQGYLGLIMETEKYYRYSPRHFGWWRNVGASAWLLHSAFAGLRK